MNYALPFLPPSDDAVLERITTTVGYASRLLTNEWTKLLNEDGTRGKAYTKNAAEVIALAGFSHPRALKDHQAMCFVYKSLFCARHYGRWIQRERPRGVGARTRRQTALTSTLPTSLQVPQAQLQMLRRLQPVRMMENWNNLRWGETSTTQDETLRTLTSFRKALPLINPTTNT